MPWPSGDQASVAIPRSACTARSPACGKSGCSSTWFTAGTSSLSAASRSRSAGRKFDTPTALARPLAAISSKVFQMATKSSRIGRGQWIRYRSTWSRRSLARESSKARSTWSRPHFCFGPFHSLVVTNSSSRASPDAATALPVPASLP